VRNRLVDATEDNMLKISAHGRLAALDMRLLEGSTPEPPCRPDVLDVGDLDEARAAEVRAGEVRAWIGVSVTALSPCRQTMA
jgi:hypothetical protein